MMKNSIQVVSNFLQDYLDRNGYAPNLAELAIGCALTEAEIERSLSRLEEQGRIFRRPGKPRSLRFLNSIQLDHLRHQTGADGVGSGE